MILNRWTSTIPTPAWEGLNGILQATRAKARGYRNVFIFMTMIYISSPHHWENSSIFTVNDENQEELLSKDE
ncbi:hypothetical protein DFAR_2810023 [Desulfarculales bacterium]